MRLNAASWPLCQLPNSGLSSWFLAITLFAQLGSSIQLITADALPGDISDGCQTALLSDVGECSLTATKFRYGYFYPESTLSSTCTADCASALVSFEKSVISACSNDTWDGYDDEGMPVAYIPGVMRFLYDLACLKDGDRFCNVVAGTNAAMADPGDGESGWLSTVANGTDAVDECDLCFVKSLRLQAGSPYYNGPVISQSSFASHYHNQLQHQLPARERSSFCSDFPTSGSLCLENTCSVYTVKTNDTSAPVPTDVAPDVNQKCGRYYQVQPDEYCNLIVLHFGISLQDFQFLNPDINENCTNLYAYESYCILPVGDINTYPGRPGATTAPPTTTLPFTSIVSLDAIVTTAPIVTSTALPLAADSREDCARFFDGQQILGEDISTTSYKNACEFAAAVWAISVDDLVQWNPDLGNVTNGECNMMPDVRYCGKLLYADPPEAQVGPDYEFDVRTGAIETCTQYADAYPDWDCNDILLNYDLTIAQFYSYNPEVGADCSNLWPST
ncbi:hypothetical protein ONZ43_g361 [Nemania bipapillata]|uniref:Uncharacterized protein n=1 Tax=Nemania bipapillata TaxID=110536 RepID=A0ACC2J8C6_9PEZI|nr:hypothetical protein ONZ43_g361 [Nemania bipapillata]